MLHSSATAGTGISRAPSKRLATPMSAGIVLLLLLFSGCTRTYYHDYADRDVYGILKARLFDWRWRVPQRKVEADPRSRMADPTNPNREPIPPDESAARRFQVSSAFPFEFHGWKKRGTEPVEFLDWQRNIPTEADGKVLLGRDSIMSLAIVNSREYQFNYEDLYLSALSLTLAQFQFMVHGFSRNGVFFQHFGNYKNNSNQLQLNTSDGFNLELMSGAQILVDLANSLVFEYSGKTFHTASPSLVLGFTQPLLRGAWARIVTQQLSLQERGVLYALREFAHYRRTFYVGLITGNGYLGLLTQLQSIRNQERNLKTLERNLQQYEDELHRGLRTVLERDQVAQTYQSTQLTLLQLEAQLQTQLDLFKIQLGLPPELEVRLDDAILNPFQLNNPRLDDFRTSTDNLYLSVLQNDEIPTADLEAVAGKLQEAFQGLNEVHSQAMKELRLWQRRLEAERKRGFSGPDAGEIQGLYERKARLARELEAVLVESEQLLKENRERVASYRDNLAKMAPDEAVQTIRDLIGKKYRERLSEIFVAQTQIRVFLIELMPVDLTVDQAIQIALANRLDLQNSLARVTDAWRNLEVDANALKGFLNFVYEGNLASAANHTTLYRFDASNSTHRFGLQFDAPINRRAERNAYREGQILYQRARRAYMLLRDQIVQQIRLDMRQLLLYRKQFDIGREQLITTARLLEQAEFALRRDPEGQPVTLNLISALQNVLSARNTLISTWVNYETMRLTLHSNFDLMDIDGNGAWSNEKDPRVLEIALRLAAKSPSPSLAIPARIPDLSGNESRGKAFFSDVRPSDRIIPDEATGTEGPLQESELLGRPPAPDGPARTTPVAPPATPSPFRPRPRT